MSNTDFEIIGITRFSYPSLKGYLKKFNSSQEAADFLYEPTRLETRIEVFEKFCLPCIEKQSHKNFRHVLLIGDDFPEWAKKRLLALTIDVPQIVIKALPAMPYNDAIDTLLANMFSKDVKFHITYWLDDDDAVDLKFIQTITECFLETRHIVENHGQLAYSQPKGIMINLAPGYIFASEARTKSPQSAGLALFSKAELKKHVYLVHHQNVNKRILLLSNRSKYSFIGTQHGLNDFRVLETEIPKRGIVPPKELLNIAQNQFGLELDEFFEN